MYKSIISYLWSKPIDTVHSINISRYILLVALLFAGVFISKPTHAQVLNTESFDATVFPPNGWTRQVVVANPGGQGTNPAVTHWSRVTNGTNPATTPNSGAGMAQFESSVVKSGGTVSLITPAFDLSARENNTSTVTFWMYRDNGASSAADKIDVYVNTGTGIGGATLLGTIHRSRSLSPTESADGWYEYSFDIPFAFSGNTNHIIFYATSQRGNNMFIDDVEWLAYPPNAPTVTTDPSSALHCAGEDVSFSASASGAPAPSVQWQVSNDGGNSWSDISGATSTNYTFTSDYADNNNQYRAVFSNNTGSDTSDVAILSLNPLPDADTGNDQPLCIGDSVQIGAAPVVGNTYSWSPSSGLSEATVSNPTAGPTETTTYILTETITATGCQNVDSVTVTVNPLPNANTGNDQTICLEESVQIGAAAVAGNTYSWSPASGLSDAAVSNPMASPSETTTYILTETITATGCQYSDSVIVTVNPLPNIVVSADFDTICNGESANLSASGGSSYSWSPADGLSATTGSNVTASPNETTIYIVTGTDGNGCSNKDSITIVVNPLPEANTGSDQEICIGENVQIGATTVAGNTYSWSPASGLSDAAISNPIASPTTTTTYTLTEVVTATACQNIDSITITVNPLPNISVSANSDTICYGESTNLSASGGNTYSWSPADGLSATTGANVTASPSETTTYVVTGTDINACSSTDTITITVNPLPLANPGNDEDICLEESVQIGATAVAGNTYSWSPAIGLSDASVSNPTASSNETTTYVLTETITATGCQNVDSVVVTVNPLPEANTSNDQTICLEESVQIGATAVAGNTYLWSPAAGLSDAAVANPMASPDEATTYVLTETISATGCQNIDSITVTVNSLPTILVSADTDTICNGESANLSASGASSYSWSPVDGLSATSGANVTASPSETITYIVTGTDGNGCSNKDSITIVVNPLPAANTGGDQDICIGENIQIGTVSVAGNTYSWSPASGLSDAAASNPTASPTETITYVLTETITSTSCQNIDSVIVTVNPLPEANTGNDQTICLEESLQIGASAVAGNTYSWSPASGLSDAAVSNPMASPADTTTYILTETISATGCQNFDSVTVSVNPLPNIVVSADFDTFCIGESANLSASGGNTYSWSPADGLSATSGANVTATPNETNTYILTGTDGNGCSSKDSITIVVNPLPEANTGNAQIICLEESIQIGATAVAGNTYSWSPASGLDDPNASNPVASPTTTTTYTLIETITATGCQNIDSVTVTVNPLPNISVSANSDTICNGESTNLSALGGSSYSWSPADGLSATSGANVMSSPSETTTYIVTGTDGNGCSNTDSVTIVVNPLPEANTGNDQTICLEESIQIGATAVAGNTYSWSPASGLSDAAISNPIASPTETTTYVLTETITATGCQNVDSVVVTVNLLPEANTGNDQTICLEESVQIGAVAVAGNTYSWSPASGLSDASASNPVASSTETTTYVLTETISATGCQKVDSVVVAVNPLPEANTGNDQTICLEESIQIGAAAVAGNTYSWSPASGLSDAVASSPVASPTETTTYVLTETITATGCQKVDSVVVTVNPLPEANTGNDQTICLEESIQIGAAAVAGNTYSWSPASGLDDAAVSNPLASPTTTTTYTLTETITATGCQNIDSVTVTVNSLPNISVSADTDTICNGESANLSASGGSSYSWSPADGLSATSGANVTASPNETTKYIVTGTDGNGCSNTDSVTIVVNSLPEANTGNDQIICLGESVQIGATAVAGNTYSWSAVNGLDDTAISNPIASPTETTTYVLTETITATGCQNIDSVVVTVNPLPSANTGGNVNICDGQSIQIGAVATAGNTYSWSPVSALNDAAVSNPVANPSDTTTYALIETITATGCQNSNQITINVQDAIAENLIEAAQTICAGDVPDELLGEAATGGDGLYNYLWESSTTSSGSGYTAASGTNTGQNYSPAVLTETTWFRRAVSSGECTDTSNVIEITVNQYPEAAGTISGTTTVCQGENNVEYEVPSIQYASGYEWSLPQGISIVSGANTNNIIVNYSDTAISGTITVHGTNGCGNGSVSADYNVTVDPLPVEADTITGVSPVCQAESGIVYSVPPIDHATDYQWTLPPGASIVSGAGTNSITVDYSDIATSGFVTVTGTNDCGTNSTQSFEVTVDPLPGSAGSISGANTICPGGQGFVFSIDSIAHATSYVWDIPSTATVLSGADSNVIVIQFDASTTPGSISVYGVNNCGISSTSTKSFDTFPYVEATAESNDTEVCETSGNINLLGKGQGFGKVTWSWTGPNGYTSGQINPVPFPATLASQGWYIVVNTDANGCSVDDSLYITVKPAPPRPIITADGPTTFCEGDSVTLISSTDSSYVSYLWSNGDTTTSTTVTTSGNYNVTVTGDNGCPIWAENAMPVTVNPLPTVNPGSERTICYGQSTQIGASPQSNRSYSWSPTATLSSATVANPIASPLDTTTYQLIVTNTATGCVDSSTVTVNVLPPIDSNLINEAQTICSGQAPDQLTGSIPTGGNHSTYTYQWEVSTDNANFSVISGATGQNYSPPVLNDTTWYRRIASSGVCTGNETNASNVIEISVLPSIDDNTIDTAQTICIGQTPDAFTGSLPTGGNGNYAYQWQVSTTSSASGFANAPGSSDQKDYTPATAHMEDTWYRRIVTSRPCVDAQSDTSNVIKVTILSIDNNTISADQNICVGDTPSVLTGSLPIGGDGAFTYLWESSTTSASTGFSAAVGANTGQDYTPGGISQTTWFRRTVYSGPCTGSFGDESNVIQITASPISNNNLSVLGNPGPFCNSGRPTSIIGSQPTGANGNYTYQWQYKSQGNNYTDIPGADSIHYIPPTLSSTTHYRRVVRSGNCEDISQKIVVVIQPSLSNNIIQAEQTVCYNTAPDTLTGTIPAGGDSTNYNFVWEYSYNTMTWIQIPGSNSRNYKPDSLTQKTYFRRAVTSGACNNPQIGNALEIDVLPINRSIWTGNIDTDWDKPMNWQCGVPDYDTDVIIPLRPNQPHIFDGVLGKCNTYYMDTATQLHIETGGRLNVKEPPQ